MAAESRFENHLKKGTLRYQKKSCSARCNQLFFLIKFYYIVRFHFSGKARNKQKQLIKSKYNLVEETAKGRCIAFYHTDYLMNFSK